MTLRPTHLALAFLLLAGPLALTQQPSGSQAAHGPDNSRGGRSRGDQRGPDDYHVMPEGMPNLWWRLPGLAQKIGLTAEQQKRMDDILNQNRQQLFHLTHELHRQRDLLQPMLDANPPEAAKILPQLDRVAQARAAEEAAFAKVLLNIRLVLTPDQWTKLQAENRHWQETHPSATPPADDHHGHNFQGKPGGTQPAQPPA